MRLPISQGDSAISLNHPVFLRSASDGQIRYAIAKGRRGTPMPAFEDMSNEDLWHLVHFIQSMKRGGE